VGRLDDERGAESDAVRASRLALLDRRHHFRFPRVALGYGVPALRSRRRQKRPLPGLVRE
jgi:hypothetical protein